MAKKAIRPIRIEGNVAYVPLTQGHEAIIDAEDVSLVEGYNWYARQDGLTAYAIRNSGLRPNSYTVLMHRVITSADCGTMVDHVDGDGLNNRRQNLRFATAQQNQQNQRKTANCASKFKGVTFHKPSQKWIARIRISGHLHYIGQFLDEDSAARAYDERAVSVAGEFAHLNFERPTA